MTDIAGATSVLIQAFEECRRRNGAGLGIQQGVVVGGDIRTALVVFDGDIEATPVPSLIGEVEIGTRVTVMFVPPHGAYVIGPKGVAVKEELMATTFPIAAGQPTCRWQQPSPTLVVATYDWTLSANPAPPNSVRLDVDLPVPLAPFANLPIGEFRVHDNPPTGFPSNQNAVTNTDRATFRFENDSTAVFNSNSVTSGDKIFGTVIYEVAPN